jgi:hypothetical protein
MIVKSIIKQEWQKSDQQKGEGTFGAGEGHHFYRPIDSYEGLHRLYSIYRHLFGMPEETLSKK